MVLYSWGYIWKGCGLVPLCPPSDNTRYKVTFIYHLTSSSGGVEEAFKDDARDEDFEDFSGVFSAALDFELLELSDFDFELPDFELLELSDFDLEVSLKEEECFFPSSFGLSFTLAGLLTFFFPSESLDLEEPCECFSDE